MPISRPQESIAKAISSGNALRMLSLHVIWIEDGVVGSLASDHHVDLSTDSDESEDSLLRGYGVFTKDEARSMMLRPGSKLRAVRLGESAYTVSTFSFV